MNFAIDIQGLNKSFGPLRAVKDLSLQIRKGSFFGFLGANGAGKSTTIHMITGLSTPSSGSIKVMGLDVEKDYLACRRLIGLTPQEFNFDRFFSLRKVLEFQAGYFGLPKAEAKERAEFVLYEMELWDKRDEHAPKLSGGMKRRLLIAKAMVHDPDILILDEPTAGIDVELRYKFWDYLRKLNAEGKTIILTTHYLEEAEQLCNELAFIQNGAILRQGTKQDIIGSSQTLEQEYLKLTGSVYAQAVGA